MLMHLTKCSKWRIIGDCLKKGDEWHTAGLDALFFCKIFAKWLYINTRMR
jgi:hypothetical protein